MQRFKARISSLPIIKTGQQKNDLLSFAFIMSEILKAKIDLLINILSGLQMGLIVKHQADFNRIRYGDVRNCGQLRKKMKSAG